MMATCDSPRGCLRGMGDLTEVAGGGGGGGMGGCRLSGRPVSKGGHAKGLLN